LNLENYFIKQFKSMKIGDDGAIVGNSIYSKDAFFENVHFKLKWITYYQVAQKAMMVNISDAVAMNAKPKYALLSVAMPKTITKAQMSDLALGFKETANKFGIEIIGGDTISNTKLDITITIISDVKKPLLRKGLKVGHLLAFTGKLGQSAKELKKLMNLGRIHTKSKFVNITLRDKFIANTTKILSSGMDISDGLLSDLDKLASINKVGFKFYSKMSQSSTCSGEEYEMLISFDKRQRKAVLRQAKKTRTPITIFASTCRAKYVNKCKAHHF